MRIYHIGQKIIWIHKNRISGGLVLDETDNTVKVETIFGTKQVVSKEFTAPCPRELKNQIQDK